MLHKNMFNFLVLLKVKMTEITPIVDGTCCRVNRTRVFKKKEKATSNVMKVSHVATKVNLVSRPRNPGLREKYILALHSKIRQAGLPESGIATRECESTSAARP
jgi:hypothetical protein